jgi:hypothetical protein
VRAPQGRKGKTLFTLDITFTCQSQHPDTLAVVVPKTGARLLGLCGTSQRGPAPRLAGCDCLGTLLTPLRINGPLGLRRALCRVEQAPAWRHIAGARAHDRLAIAGEPRGPGRRLGLGQALLGLAPGRRAPGEPREAGLG